MDETKKNQMLKTVIFLLKINKKFSFGDVWNIICVGGRVISKRGGLSSLFHQPIFVIGTVLECFVG